MATEAAITTKNPPPPPKDASIPALEAPKDTLPSNRISLCPHCGAERHDITLPEHAQERISELESEVRVLTGKATDAVDKLADYEDKLRQLRAEKIAAQPGATAIAYKEHEPLPPTPVTGESSTLYKRPSTTGRFSSFLSRRGSPVTIPNSQTPPPPPTTLVSSREDELNAAISQERSLRQEAEQKVNMMSAEVEELSTTLFQQANEMVSTERQARAKLEERASRFEERCELLEEKVRILEKRDADKKRRLERLEEAVKRCERARTLLQAGVR